MSRVVALDLARFLAVVGMVGAHLLRDGAPGWALVAVTGFPSTAFAVIGGASAVLATRRRTADGQHLAAAASLATRGLLVAVIGFALEPLSGPIIVVLAYFGVGLVCLAALLRLPSSALLVGAAALAVVGPWLNLAVRGDDAGATAASPDASLDLPVTLGFAGLYPVVTWLVYLLLGAVIGRVLVARRTPPAAVGARLAALGAVGLAVALAGDLLTGTPAAPGVRGEGAPVGTGLRLLLDTTPHSGSLGDVVRTAGAACLVLGLLLVATQGRDRVPAVLEPVRAAGAAPLTVYVLHVVVVGLLTSVAYAAGSLTVYSATPDWWVGGPVALLLHVLGALAVGAWLSWRRRRGPLEAAVGALSDVVGHAVSARVPVATR